MAAIDTEEQSARLELSAGPVQLNAHLRMTPAGLLSVGALVSVLLTTSLLVWTSTTALRRHPIASRVPLKL